MEGFTVWPFTRLPGNNIIDNNCVKAVNSAARFHLLRLSFGAELNKSHLLFLAATKVNLTTGLICN